MEEQNLGFLTFYKTPNLSLRFNPFKVHFLLILNIQLNLFETWNIKLPTPMSGNYKKLQKTTLYF
jgi:hypothetical protein